LSIRRASSEDEKSVKALKVSKLLLGDPDHGVEPKSVSDIRAIIGFKQTKSVYDYIKIAIKLGYLQLDSTGKPILPKKSASEKFHLYTQKHELSKDDYIVYWLDKQMLKKGGSGIQMAHPMFGYLLRFFNTLRITPEQLIYEKSPKVVEDYRDEYIKAVKAGTDWKQKTGRKSDMPNLMLRMNYSLVSLCSVHGISWERGTPSMSRKITGHGKYSHVRLTDEEFEKADNYLIEKYGINSNEYRWFWVGVETCCRFNALFSMKLQYDVIKSGNSKRTFIMSAFESKTKEIKDGLFTKWIKRENTQKALESLKNRGGIKIYETDLSNQKFRELMENHMKDLFRFLGKDPDSLFFKRATHVLRHLGAHYWLAKGNYTNHVLVAKVGGWHTVDELIKSYGEVPPEKVNQELDKYDYQ